MQNKEHEQKRVLRLKLIACLSFPITVIVALSITLGFRFTSMRSLTILMVILVVLILASSIFMTCALRRPCTIYVYGEKHIMLYSGLLHRYIKIDDVKTELAFLGKYRGGYNSIYGCVLSDGMPVEVMIMPTEKVVGVKVNGHILPRAK